MTATTSSSTSTKMLTPLSMMANAESDQYYNADSDQQFRLKKINYLDEYLEREVSQRKSLYEKYYKACNGLDAASTGVGVIGLGLEITGTALIGTGIGAVPGIVLNIVGGFSIVSNLIFSTIRRRCAIKAGKHEAIMHIATAKLVTIHGRVSSALNDCNVSDSEFNDIVHEVADYTRMKEAIRKNSKESESLTGNVVDEETKQKLLAFSRRGPVGVDVEPTAAEASRASNRTRKFDDNDEHQPNSSRRHVTSHL